MRSHYPQLGLKLLIVGNFFTQALATSTAPTPLRYVNHDNSPSVTSHSAARRYQQHSAQHQQRQIPNQRLAATDAATPGEPIRWDADWRFYAGEAQGAEKPDFDDASWRALDLPHDWSIEDVPGTTSPYQATAISQVNGGFTRGGTGWYRKRFTLPAGAAGQRVIVQFDGVYMNASVWLNGHQLGTHPYGYTPFWYDLTEHLNPNGPNVLAVQVQNEGVNSRWYSGSGIYRHVWLRVLPSVHLTPWGISLTTPSVMATQAQVQAKTTVRNETVSPAEVTVVTRILNPAGKEVGKAETRQTLAANAALDFSQTIAVKAPVRWSPATPALYTAVSEVFQQNTLLERRQSRFGIRTLDFDVTQGFRLNGQPLKLKGGCIHHDNGPLGAKAYDRAEERKVALLKANGFNALRITHNPPSPALLDACDRLGMLVIEEAFDMWREAKNPNDYHLYFDEWWQRDLASMVQRDGNHPSVFMWSIGNEIPERNKPAGVQTATLLASYLKKLDPTRRVTSGVNGLSPALDPYFATLDVGGYNYVAGGYPTDLYALDHQRQPKRLMYGSESYPLDAFKSWALVEAHPWVIGDFVWTAFDYMGEASIGWRGYDQSPDFYPWNLAYCGDLDVCGWKRPQSYYRDALWRKNQVSVFVEPPTPSFPTNPKRQSWSRWHWHDAVASWNWPGQEGKPLHVSAYSSCEEVELLLDGKSLGKRPTTRAKEFMATWEVPYQAGVLRAVGYQGGKAVQSAELRTASAPVQVKLTADRPHLLADGQDLSYVTVELVDAAGVRHPQAENDVQFALEGPGTIVGVGNANPVSVESSQLPQRKAWQGRCLVIIKAGTQPGNLVLKASAAGLKPAALTLTAQAGSAAAR
ncbi:MAG: sugar-binding domain-containing protein [Janthinobacterium lividum]